MSEEQTLFVVLVAIYLSETLFWLRRESVAFLQFVRPSWRVVDGGTIPEGRTIRLQMANPIPPLGSMFVCQQWPMSLSQVAAYSYVAQTFIPGSRPEQNARYIPFEQMRSVEVSNKSLLVNGIPFLTTNSMRLTHHICRLLRRLRKMNMQERQKTIDNELERLFDTKAISRVLAHWQEEKRGLSLYCNLLFVFLFVVSPAVVQLLGLVAVWIPLLASLVILLVGILIEYWLVHVSVYPDSPRPSKVKLAVMALSPLAAIRAGDALSKELLSTFHPLAVAHVLCTAEDFRRWATGIVRDARFPIQPPCPSDEEQHQAVEKFFRDRLCEKLNEFVGRTVGPPEEYLQAPIPESEDCLSYCPRCQVQYRISKGTCLECGALPLAPMLGKSDAGRSDIPSS